MRINQSILIICFLWLSATHAQQSVIDSLETEVAKNTRDVDMANALNKLASAYSKRDTEKAKIYAWRAIKLSKTLQNNKTLAAATALLVYIYKNTSQQDSTDFYLAALKNLATTAKPEDSDDINLVYNSTIGLYYNSNGKSKEALPFLLKGYEYSKKIGKEEDIYGQAINLGNCYYMQGAYKKSLEYHFVALKGFENLGNKTGQSFCYNNISNCYYELNRFAESISYLKKSIKLKNELGDKRGLANAEQNLGNNYMGLEDFVTAEKHFKNAIAINKEMNFTSGLITNYFNIGRLYAENDPQSALSYFNKSKEIATENKDSFMIAKNNLEILAVKAMSEKKVQSEENALINVQGFKEAGNRRDEADGYKNLADYYTKNNQYEKALEYTNRYYQLRDTIKSNEILAEFKNIEEKYNKEKNEKQIVLLQKDQQINEQKLSRQRFLMVIFGLIIVFTGIGIYMFINRNRLKQRMQELELRNRIAADLHDEVGSSLSSIYMLSQMAGKEQFDAKGDIMEKVKTNAKETMEKMGDIVWMIKPNENEGEDLKSRMERFIHEICNSQNIACSFSADGLMEVKLDMKQKKNVYLIFKEAVNNALKYSETKKLEVHITRMDKQLEMEIKDFGKGFNERTIQKGNGLDNMKNRSKELNGKIEFNSKPEMGTTVQLSFPI